MEKIISRDPSSGRTIREYEQTTSAELSKIFEQAREAQIRWASVPAKERGKKLLDLRETILNHFDEIVELIMLENGKPKMEAMSHDLLPSLELLTFFGKSGPKMLKDKGVFIHNPILLGRRSYLNFWPLGVVAVISPWNFPFLLPFGEIVMALISGNAVVFKPSEITPSIGLKIQEMVDAAGFPKHLVQTVIGDGSVGAAIIEQKPAKIFFTGSVATGKKIMAAASKHLIPVCLELGGKDPMIILPDADLDFASSAALWGAFTNLGQVCASTERILVHESIAKPFIEKLKEKTSQLRPRVRSNGKEYDLGSITMEKQKAVYQQQLDQIRAKGAEIYTGGKFSDDRTFIEPTLVGGPNVESLDVYKEETFGPIKAITTFKTPEEAVRKANETKYGLLASVVGGDLTAAENIARQIEAGTVCVNEVAYTAAIPETPWGGLKESGIGRKHSELGLLEFVNVRHIHRPRFQWLQHKSFWWYPYTHFQTETFRKFCEMYRKSWARKLSTLPMFLWSFVSMMKSEKRL